MQMCRDWPVVCVVEMKICLLITVVVECIAEFWNSVYVWSGTVQHF